MLLGAPPTCREAQGLGLWKEPPDRCRVSHCCTRLQSAVRGNVTQHPPGRTKLTSHRRPQRPHVSWPRHVAGRRPERGRERGAVRAGHQHGAAGLSAHLCLSVLVGVGPGGAWDRSSSVCAARGTKEAHAKPHILRGSICMKHPEQVSL